MSNYKKLKLLKGTTVSGGATVYDDDYVTSPRGSISVKKGKTSITGGIEKPFSKKSKENINSEISLGIERGDESGSFSLTGTKRGKSKNVGFSFSKKFSRGGETEKPIARNKKNYRSTKSGAGMTAAGVAAYRRANPGSKLKTAVTGKVKKGSKAANRRKSYCARSLGQLKRSSAETRNDPNSRIRQARRRWKC
jgi:hypothetical protein